jgi:uncharacterized membrane protein YcaP (DUF421 family)
MFYSEYRFKSVFKIFFGGDFLVTIIIRTLIIYAVLLLAMRLMGKRQIGQLEVSDLVSTLLLSELAALPIENHSIPLAYSLIPTILLMSIEIFTAAIQGKFPQLKNLFSPRPSILIRMGKPDFSELEKCRMSADELLIALRRAGTTDISEVAYAILEQDGNVSVIPRAFAKPATAKDVAAGNTESGIYRIIVDRGIPNAHSLSQLSLDIDWVQNSVNVPISDIRLMLADEIGNIQVFTESGE